MIAVTLLSRRICCTLTTQGSLGNARSLVQVDTINGQLDTLGPQFEKHDAFPARINTHFVEALSREHLRMTVWERGAGRTLACGTGACAVVVAAVLEGRAERNCQVDLPGGPLQIEWRASDNHIYMTGPAQLAFKGTLQLAPL